MFDASKRLNSTEMFFGCLSKNCFWFLFCFNTNGSTNVRNVRIDFYQWNVFKKQSQNFCLDIRDQFLLIHEDHSPGLERKKGRFRCFSLEATWVSTTSSPRVQVSRESARRLRKQRQIAPVLASPVTLGSRGQVLHIFLPCQPIKLQAQAVLFWQVVFPQPQPIIGTYSFCLRQIDTF